MSGDLRDYLSRVEQADRLKLVEGADWNVEIGVLTELFCTPPESTLALFDKIKGYPPGYRVAANLMSTPRRFALATGLPLEARGLDLVNAWRAKIGEGFTRMPPTEVKTGPITENVHTDVDVDVLEFPAPKWHELDGGRYIGTCDMVVVKDPDSGWVNFGTYRVQIHDK
ncbi:MAG TPA: UbiD family decarboxylase, partial [Thermoleophilia bacterium]|nr:UbiD family decarboxylase [Thermoleophilia bacterium]